MKLIASLAGQENQMAIRCRDGRVSAEISGRHYELEGQDLGQGEYLFTDGTNVYNCLVSTGRGRPGSFEVHLRSRTYEISIVDLRRLRSGQSAGSHEHGAVEVVAPMSGKVVRVLVAVGARVEAGVGIAVVEAMKMQNEMKAPKGGTVVSLQVAAGATVNAGDVLAVIE
jgi:acetyl/propionyl-CoA carboxylase alpha subunit